MGFRISFYAPTHNRRTGRVRWFLINLAASFYTRYVSIIINVTRRTAHYQQCFASVSFFPCNFTINVSAPRSNLLRDGEPSDDNVDRSGRGYVPVQPLAYDHGVSLVPLSSLPDSDDFTIGHHELQVRNGLPGPSYGVRVAGGRRLGAPKGPWEEPVRRAENGPKTAAWNNRPALCFRPCTTVPRSCTGTPWRAAAGPPGCFCGWKGTARRWRGARPRGARWNAARPDRPTIRWSPTVKTPYPTRCSTGRPSVARRSWVSALRPCGRG